MANATVITITDLTLNGFTAKPAANTLDTGTVPVTLYGTVSSGKQGPIFVEITNFMGTALTVAPAAGSAPPAFRAGIASPSTAIAAGTTTVLFGPIETAQFFDSNNRFGITFTPAGTVAISAEIRAYRVPPGW